MARERSDFRIPNEVKKILAEGEKVQSSIHQSRLKNTFTPDAIILTDQRIIRYSPSALGLRKQIEDYRYENIANVKVSKGIMFATMTIKPRFMGEGLVLDNLPKSRVDNISKIVQENIRRTSSTSAPQVPGKQTLASPQREDSIQLIKLRLAKGEITKEEYEQIKKLLE